MLPEMLVPEGYNTFCLGKWHLSPGGGEHAGRPVPPLAARPRLRALLRLPRRRDQPVVSRPDAGQQPDAPAEGPRGRLPPQRGPGRPGDQDGRSTRTSTRPRSRSSCTTRPGPRTRRTTCRKEWADRYKGQFDGGWDAYRETVFANQKKIGLLPAGRGALAARPRRARVVDAVRRRAAALRPDDGGLRRLRRARRPPLRPHPGHARADRRAREHADHGHLRQRRLGRGRRHRLVQRDALLQPGAGELRGQPRADRRARRPVVLQPLPVGLGVGGQHAVPALEARDLPRRLDRPVHPRLAGRDAGPRRDPHAVRARDRHGPDRARRARRRAAGDDPRRAADRRWRASASRTRSTTRRRRREHLTQYFEMFGHRAIYHDGWRAVCPWPAPNFTDRGEARPQARRRRSRPRSSRSSTAAAGSCTTWPTTRPSRATSPPSTRTVVRELIALLVGGGRASTRCCRSTARCRRGWRPSARRRPSRAAASSTTRAARSCRRSRRRRSTTAPYSIEADVDDPRRRRRGRAGRPGRRRRRLHVLRQGRAAALPLQLRRPRPLRGARRQRRPARGPARAALRVRADRRAGHRQRQGRPRDAASSTSTASSSATTEFPHTTPLLFELEGLSCGYDFGAPAAEGYEPPFPFTGTIRQVAVDLAGELIADDEAEMRVLMARQ